MIERGLDHGLEQGLVASQIGTAVACHADHGTLDLGRRIEYIFMDREEVFDVVPGLEQDTQDAVGLLAWRGSQSLGHLFLNHAGTAGNLFFVVQYLEKDLAGDVVGVVADHAEGAFVQLMQVEFQEILSQDASFQRWKVLLQVIDRFAV